MSNHIAELSRRRLLIGAGVLAAGAAVAGAPAAAAAPSSSDTAIDPDGSRDRGDVRGPKPQVNGLHLQFGHDASREVVVSWHTLMPVSGARAVIGRPDGEFLASAKATTRSYLDQQGGVTVYAHHARFDRLSPGTSYLYAALHTGAAPQFGQFATVPRGRTRVTFTSFGDQGTPTLGKLFQPPVGVTLPRIPWVNDNLGSPSAGDTTAGVEQVAPMFHPGSTSGRTTPARRATARGCRRPVTTRTSTETDRSGTGPTRPTSNCPPRTVRRTSPVASGTPSPPVRSG